jgi:hypothetical protein
MHRLDANTVVVADPDALSSVVGEEAVILHFTAGTYFGLNDVGSRIWELVATPRSVGEICEKLVEEYDVEVDRCERAVVALLQEMIDNNLISIDAPAAG